MKGDSGTFIWQDLVDTGGFTAGFR